MKIILGVPEFPPYHVGGGGPVFSALANEYKKLGHEVMVIYGYYPTKHGFESIQEYTKDGIHFVQVPLIPTPGFLGFLKTVLPTMPWHLKGLSQIIKQFAPDKAHIHGFGLLFINQLATILWTQHIPYIYTLHGAPVSADKKGGLIKRLYNFYKQTRGKSILEHASEITAVSQYTIENFTEFYPYKDRMRVIPNGIYTEEFEKKIDYNIYDQYKFPETATIFLSIGRVEWIKGFDQFIRMIPSLVKEGVDVRYCMAGRDNGFQKELVRLAIELGVRDRVYFMGYIGGDDKLSMLQNADYGIVTSHTESFGLTVLEMQASGLRPIVNKIGALEELILESDHGTVIDFSNIDNYVKILHCKSMESMYFSQFYSRKTIANKYLS